MLNRSVPPPCRALVYSPSATVPHAVGPALPLPLPGPPAEERPGLIDGRAVGFGPRFRSGRQSRRSALCSLWNQLRACCRTKILDLHFLFRRLGCVSKIQFGDSNTGLRSIGFASPAYLRVSASNHKDLRLRRVQLHRHRFRHHRLGSSSTGFGLVEEL